MTLADKKKIWLDALRSGEYKQAKDTLHNLDTGGFCCLGVAAKVWGLGDPEWFGRGYENGQGWIDSGPESIYDNIANITSGEYWISDAIAMNDNETPFQIIADFIEEHWVIEEPTLEQ